VALIPEKGLRINSFILIGSGIVLLVLSFLVFLYILKFIYGDFEVREILPTKYNLTRVNEDRRVKVGVLYSKYTESMLPEGNTWLKDNIDSWEKLLRSMEMRYEIISDYKIEAEDLSEYGLIILPGSKSLSDRQIVKLKKYQENGGSLLATCGTSTFSDDGKWRGWQFLLEVFGLSFTREIGENEEYRILTLRGSLPVTANIPAGFKLKVAPWDRPVFTKVMEPRTTAVSTWFDIKKDSGLVMEEIRKSIGSAYGTYGKGRFFWLGFDMNSVIGHQNEFIYFDRLLRNALNWLTYHPVVQIEEWPSGKVAAAIITPVIEGLPHNIKNIGPALKASGVSYNAFADYNNPKAVAILKEISGSSSPGFLLNLGRKEFAADTVNKLFSGGYQNRLMKRGYSKLDSIDQKSRKGFFPYYGYFDENTLKAMSLSGISFLITDSVSDRSVPFLEIRNEKPLMIIPINNRDDKEIIGKLKLWQRNFQEYTYEEDIEKAIFEGGLYVMKMHTEYQLRPEYSDVIRMLITYIKERPIWLTNINQLFSWWTFRNNLEIRSEIRSPKRIFLEVSNPDRIMIEDFTVTIYINKPIKDIKISSDIINTEIPEFSYDELNQIIRVNLKNFKKGESRSFLIDYENAGSSKTKK